MNRRPRSGTARDADSAGRPTEFTIGISRSPAPSATFGVSPADTELATVPEVSIVTVTYATSTVLESMLGSLAEALSIDGLFAEVIMVDNPHPVRGHACADRATLQTAGLTIVRPNENLGFGGGNNLGVGQARGDIIVLLNPDTVIEAGQLPELVAHSRRHPGDIVAPSLLNTDGSLQERGMTILSNADTRPVRDPNNEHVDYASAACWVLHRRLFDDVGGFDPAYFPAYYEDVDFALRVAEQGGHTRIVDGVGIVHAWRSGKADQIPDVSDQKRIFIDRWGDLVASRPAPDMFPAH